MSRSRSAIINQASPVKEALGILTGQWMFYESQGWRCVKLPFLFACSGTFGAGSHALPVTFSGTVVALIAYGDGTSEQRVIKQGEQAVKISAPAYIQINQLTDTGDL